MIRDFKCKHILYFYYFRAEDEAEFREFLETVAVVLCSDIEITPDTFHRAARGYGVSQDIIDTILTFGTMNIIEMFFIAIVIT